MEGMVLVDPGIIFGHPDAPPEIDAHWRAENRELIAVAPLLARLGLMRLANMLGADGGAGELAPEDRAAFYAGANRAQFWDAIAAEYAALLATSRQELNITSLGNLPLVVLSAEQPADARRDAWTALNAGMARLSGRGEHRVVAGAHHMAFAWERAYADVVVGAIRELLVTVRADTPTGASK